MQILNGQLHPNYGTQRTDQFLAQNMIGFFESILIPMFLVVGIWGSRERKMLAAYYFFLYTLLGSVVMLLSILYIYSQAGSTDYEILLTFVFSDFEQKILWFTITRFLLSHHRDQIYPYSHLH